MQQRTPPPTGLVDVLERVLEKGVVKLSAFAVIGTTAIAVPAFAAQPSGTQRELHGQVVEITDSELIVRSEDGRLHFVNTAAIPTEELGTLEPDDGVTITTKGESPRGPIGGSARRHPRAPQ